MIGDPAGIGPEICVRSIASGELSPEAAHVLIGSLGALENAARACGVKVGLKAYRRFEDIEFAPGTTPVLDPGHFDAAACRYGASAASCGKAVLEWLDLAQSLAEQGKLAAWVNSPVDTHAILLTGLSREKAYERFEPPATYQLRIGGKLRAVPITEHVRMREIAGLVKRGRVLEVVKTTHAALVRWGLPTPKIAVAGLNPHAMFEEDKEEIAPAVSDAKALGIAAQGPITPDAVFRLALEGRYDAVVTMYHDQGQIALKTAAFEGACTVFLGLPYIRIGTPHGVAFDIAGTGKAQHATQLEAMKTAGALAAGRGFLA